MQLVGQVPLKKKRNKIHPYKFALWVACAAIVMMFAALTSAYMVRKSGGNWLEFTLPNVFYINTLVILLSSISIHGAYLAFKKNNHKLYKILLSGGAILGLTFVTLQYQGWQELIAQGIELKTNPSSSFLYVISGLHLAHIIPGIVAIVLAFIFAFIRKQEVTPLSKLRLELVVHYWHFVDFLWVYLFVFLLLQ
ncbi:MAG: cytochrome c oxidase subunit 3 [Saprospiraceae bacterium]